VSSIRGTYQTGGTLLFTVLCVYCDEQAQERKDNQYDFCQGLFYSLRNALLLASKNKPTLLQAFQGCNSVGSSLF